MPGQPKPTHVPEKTGSAMDHGDPWKEDGNIVLAAEGKYFRVHRSVLSAHSEVFKDMFDCPHSMEAEKEFIDRYPVIRLHDSAEEVQTMLKALYDRGFPVPYYEKMPFSSVAAFLRLGEKYIISVLVNEAKAKLRCAAGPVKGIPLHTQVLDPLFPAITDTDPHHFQVMNLLQEMGIKTHLPLAMYYCIISCPLTSIIDGYKSNGSIYSLSPANLKTFISMKDVLDNFRLRLAIDICAPSFCTRTYCTQNLHGRWLEEVNVLAPFAYWRHEWDELLCEDCRRKVKAKRDAEMHKAWSRAQRAFRG